jgi:hypothetical protein
LQNRRYDGGDGELFGLAAARRRLRHTSERIVGRLRAGGRGEVANRPSIFLDRAMSFIPNPSARVEQVVLAYISSSLSGQGLLDPSTNWYTGLAVSDKAGPAVVVACNQAQEVYFNSRVYRFDIDVTCKQIAFDSTTSSAVSGSMINLAGNVNALFGESVTSSLAINLTTASGSNDFWVYQTQAQGFEQSRIEDAWLSNLKLEVVGMLCASASNYLPQINLI